MFCCAVLAIRSSGLVHFSFIIRRFISFIGLRLDAVSFVLSEMTFWGMFSFRPLPRLQINRNLCVFVFVFFSLQFSSCRFLKDKGS